MINFPILDRLDITNYGLFPGTKGSGDGLHVQFKSGLTLILGANGLGKSTLVYIVYRLLTGPFDIPGLAGRTDLGTTRLETTQLSARGRGVFAERVADGARNAVAQLSLKLGTHTILVERRLRDLTLTRLLIDGKAIGVDEVKNYQSEILRLVGVWAFADWVLLLRHLTFYFEDRRALVWDASAQRQILRFLFLPAATARKWSEDERAILELDSRMRNLSAALFREERALAANEGLKAGSGDLRQELKALEKLHKNDEERLERLEGEVVEVASQRQAARLRSMQADKEREARFREVERARLSAISARFPSRSETARYILAQLLAEGVCLVCTHAAPDAQAGYVERIDHGRCIVCGTDLTAEDGLVTSTKIADARERRASKGLESIEKEVAQSKASLDEAERAYQLHFEEIQRIRAQHSARSVRIDILVSQLPPAEAELHRQRAELGAMRSRVEELRIELTNKRKIFRRFLESVSRKLAAQSKRIKTSFDRFAKGFLVETCHLIWSPNKARLGETGETIEFPAFEIEMTGPDFEMPVRRTGPEQVSESQREFIDLAFRMALMSVGGSKGVGTLMIDAPETSLDAVFVTRAADVLARFAKASKGNRLVLTSNLVEGKLIPDLLRKTTTTTDRMARIVNLFDLAAPTAAVQQLRGEYAAVQKLLLKAARAPQ